jgi:hypothetical protein
MKYIKLFEEITNLSKIRKWPSYKNGNSDFYFIYKLHKKDLGNYLNTWFVGEMNVLKNNQIATDEIVTLIKVDDETSTHLYHKLYNVLSIRIMCPPGAKFTKDKYGNDLYQMKAQIHSIDDSSYGIWWDKLSLEKLKDMREKLMSWVNQNNNKMNGELFLDKCVELGANTESKDYN